MQGYIAWVTAAVHRLWRVGGAVFSLLLLLLLLLLLHSGSCGISLSVLPPRVRIHRQISKELQQLIIPDHLVRL